MTLLDPGLRARRGSIIDGAVGGAGNDTPGSVNRPGGDA